MGAHLIATAVLVTSGLGALSLLDRVGAASRGGAERVALGYFLGLLLATAGLFLPGWAGVALSRPAALAVPALLTAVWLVSVVRSPGPPLRERRPRLPSRWWQWLLLALIAGKCMYVLAMNATELRRVDDAFRWALPLGKHAFFEGSPTDFEMDRGYPRMPGLALCWFALVRGRWDELAMNFVHFNYFAFLLLLFHANLSRIVGRSVALVGTYALSSLPLVLAHSVLIGYADLPLSVLVCFTGVYAYRYAAGGETGNLVLAAVLALALPSVKLEGAFPFLLLGVHVALAAAAFRGGWCSGRAVWAASGALVAAALAGVFLANAAWGGEAPPFVHESVWSRVRPVGAEHWGRVHRALIAHFGHAFNNWMVIGTLAGAAVVPLAIRRMPRAEGVIGLYAVLHVTAFLYVFGLGGAWEFLVNGTTVNRSFLQLAPLLLFTCCLLVGADARGAARAHSSPERSSA